jgi:hypothetical protein
MSRYAIVEGGVVVNIAESDAPLALNWLPVGDGVQIGHLHADGEFTAPEPAMDWPTMKEEARRAVRSRINAVARSRGYDDGNSLASYASDPNPVWAAEAAAFIAWRSAVWSLVIGLMEAVEAEEAEPPEDIAALMALLPEINWTEED